MNTSAQLTRPTDTWPAFTTHSPGDVVIAAVSLVRLVEWCGTPCVHTADAADPSTNGHPSDTELASVVIARVTSVELRSDLLLHVGIDADLAGCRPTGAAAVLIGRASTSAVASARLGSGRTFATSLPADVVVGDLVVIPCEGVTTLHDVKLASSVTSRTRPGRDAAGFGPTPSAAPGR